MFHLRVTNTYLSVTDNALGCPKDSKIVQGDSAEACAITNQFGELKLKESFMSRSVRGTSCRRFLRPMYTHSGKRKEIRKML